MLSKRLGRCPEIRRSPAAGDIRRRGKPARGEVEMAESLRAFGAEVFVVPGVEKILPGEEREIS